MNIIAGFQNNFSEGLYTKFKSYRYRVFVEYLGWELNCPNNEELDQFDKVDTAYVVAQDRESNIIGCARLLPTTQPYLLGEIFPQLLNGMPIPCSPEIWELSRFSAVDFQIRLPLTVRLCHHLSQLQFCKKQSTLQENKAQNNSLRLLLLE